MWIFCVFYGALFLDGIKPVIKPDVFTVGPGGNTVIHADTEDCRPASGIFETQFISPHGIRCTAQRTKTNLPAAILVGRCWMVETDSQRERYF
ncbi:UNVERIFIED_ORG: hypothetical protein J2X79_001999 [Arthrobacter globiformis]|nr:hypothetical protein [Arthrobacter globiformis]